jgi:glycosyltransferase involved in cell wall biosynthesis
MKYQFVVFLLNHPHKNTASSKALADCEQIFNDNEYKSLNVYIVRSTTQLLFTLAKFSYHIMKMIKKVEDNSTIVVQYPILGFNGYMKWLIKVLKRKGTKFICIIHDIESLRTMQPNLYAREIENLSAYDVVISHNKYMTGWLKEQGLAAPMVSLELFDYLLDQSKPLTYTLPEDAQAGGYTIAFAGNLEKSAFIHQLQDLHNVKFNLYGPGYTVASGTRISNTKWCGSHSPEDIPFKLDGHFGLLWDGDSLSGCTGALGFYLQYNNPHKLSLYIAAGLPVIVPANCAVADIVREHQIGICVNSLTEIENVLANTTVDMVATYRTNILKLREKVITGSNLSAALATAEKIIEQTAAELCKVS